MSWNWLINVGLTVYNFYIKVWNFFFRIVGRIYLVYQYKDDKFTNVTLQYYLGLINNRLSEYVVNIINKNGSNYFIINCYPENFANLILDQESYVKRKNFQFLNNNRIVNINLQLLDNYVVNRKNNNLEGVSPNNIGVILRMLGYNCSHVQIINIMPFEKVVKCVDSVTINDLYS
jgi:hypothetical protein